jgi:hypothetical protein
VQRQPGKFVQTHLLRLGSFLSICLIPGPFVAQVESPNSQVTNTQSSRGGIEFWVPLAIASFALVGATITLVATWLKLRTANTERHKAETERHKAETERTTAEIQLKAEQEARARAENQLEIEHIQNVFDRSRCSGSTICKEILCLGVCKTFKQAAASLESLTNEFGKATATIPQAAVEWAQDEVHRVCDGQYKVSLSQPGEYRLVETKAFECYASIIPWLNDESQIQRAIDHCRGWVQIRQGREGQRLETVRLLLRALLRADPKKPELLAICDDAIRSGWDASENHRQDVSNAALAILPTVNGLEPHGLYTLLQTGLSVAARSWGVFGVTWSQAIHDSLEGTVRLEGTQLRQLARQVSSHIQSQKPDILTRAREGEYMALSSVLAQMHTALGDNRKTRPKNRHIVPTNQPVEVLLALRSGAGPERVVRGNLGNFSISGPQPGAWVTSVENGGLQCVTSDEWKCGTMSISGNPSPQLDFEVSVRGPLPEEPQNNPFGHSFGYRLRFGNLSSDDMHKLAELGTRFPNTQ